MYLTVQSKLGLKISDQKMKNVTPGRGGPTVVSFGLKTEEIPSES